jgi:hypothetical protein
MVKGIREKYLDKKYRDKTWSEVVNAPISAINGVSEKDGEYLKRAFNIDTIQDFATNKFVRIAQTIVSLTDLEKYAR